MTTHGLSYSREYFVWNAMVRRCTDPGNPAFKNYGARGIQVCDRWLKFKNFFADIGHIPTGMTIDRKDNDRGYEPGNVQFSIRKEQNRNRRGLVQVEFSGRSAPLWQWCEENGARVKVTWGRLRRGWPLDLALFSAGRQHLSTATAITVVPESFRAKHAREAIEAEGPNSALIGDGQS